MLNHILNLLCLALIVVFIVDLSGAIDSLKKFISKVLTNGHIQSNNFNLKPFDCSLCSTWWTGFTYLLITHTFTLPMIAYVALLAFLANVFANILLLLKDVLLYTINKLSNLL
jgi:hypothetical protein